VPKNFQGITVVGQGSALVLLHSSLSSAKQWRPLVAQLKAQYLIINIDMYGYGHAPEVKFPESYDFNVEATRINSALEEIIGEQSFHLVGHSCGGALALKLAVTQPEKILSLSLYEPVAFHLLAKGSDERKNADEFARKVNITDGFLAAEMFTDHWNKPGFFKSLPKRMQNLMAQDMPKVNLDFIALTAERYGLEALAAIQCPSIILLGQYSPSLSHQLSTTIYNALPNSQIEFFDCGHMGPISDSDIVQPAIARFIIRKTIN
jgi:pimeloyl-ACP methyl ester carboxylesterase